MFQVLELMFQVLKLMFPILEHKFPILEHKMQLALILVSSRRKETYSYAWEEFQWEIAMTGYSTVWQKNGKERRRGYKQKKQLSNENCSFVHP